VCDQLCHVVVGLAAAGEHHTVVLTSVRAQGVLVS
jgi:hypothetical protein